MSKFGKFKPGDAPVFKADTVNAWQDVAQWYAESGFGGKGGQALGGVNALPATQVTVEASEDTTFLAILTPTGISANDPATNPVEARRRPCITAGVPTSEDDHIVIVTDPALPGGLARAAATGLAPCRVLVTDESHRYARPEPGNSEYLVSDDFGPALLYLPMSVGTEVTDAEPQQTLVLLGFPSSGVSSESSGPKPLGMPCLIRDGYGNVIGMAQRWVQEDGSVKCETSGVCEGEGCGADSIPDPDPDPDPDPPHEPPDPPPETYDVFVQVWENYAVDGICSAPPTEPGTYSVTVADSIEGSQVVPVGGIWFTGIPWGTDTAAVLSYGGPDLVWHNESSIGCGGSSSGGWGTTATLNGSFCDNMAVAFTIGDCGGVFPPTSIDAIEVEKPIEVE